MAGFGGRMGFGGGHRKPRAGAPAPSRTRGSVGEGENCEYEPIS